MSLADMILSCFKDMEKLPDGHILRKRFEEALNGYCIKRWGRPVIKDPTEELDPTVATIQEIRNAATTLYQEAERLELLPEAKQLFSIMKQGSKTFLFLDKEEKATRYWALQNPSDENRMYEEWWVSDPLKEGKKRCIKRIPMDIPTITARNQTLAEQSPTQKNQPSV